MATKEDQILRAAKEIVVKFIETGRVSPTGFPDAFRTVYQAVDAVVNERAPGAAEEGEDRTG